MAETSKIQSVTKTDVFVTLCLFLGWLYNAKT